MVVTIDELEAAGLAERRPSPTDRRARVIAVTKAGERKLRDADEIVARTHKDVLGALPVKDRKVFLDSLVHLVAGRLSTPSECSQPVRRRASKG
jgi:DNA-binding MarR family transcriptional regulator